SVHKDQHDGFDVPICKRIDAGAVNDLLSKQRFVIWRKIMIGRTDARHRRARQHNTGGPVFSATRRRQPRDQECTALEEDHRTSIRQARSETDGLSPTMWKTGSVYPCPRRYTTIKPAFCGCFGLTRGPWDAYHDSRRCRS